MKRFKKIIYQIILFLSLVIIGFRVCGDYEYEVEVGVFYFGISFAIIVSYLWSKINKKFFS